MEQEDIISRILRGEEHPGPEIAIRNSEINTINCRGDNGGKYNDDGYVGRNYGDIRRNHRTNGHLSAIIELFCRWRNYGYGVILNYSPETQTINNFMHRPTR